MIDFYEIDFLGVGSKKSGDAIGIRYAIDGEEFIHVVDGGYQLTGEKLVRHIQQHYGNPSFINHVVATHPDGDHCGGLCDVLENFEVGTLWMFCPWHYTEYLIERFSRFTNHQNLARRLKEIYPGIAKLEETAIRRGVKILPPFQGETIGAFTVLSPTPAHYLELVERSEKTPEAVSEERERTLIESGLRIVAKLVSALWGDELFSPNETSAENEMSVIQWANLVEDDVVLTADAGREALSAAAEFAPFVGLSLPGVTKIQVPHHGSRRNVNSEILDAWLGDRHSVMPSEYTTTAFVSASAEDKHHPRNAVVRGFMHRGAKVISTEGWGWIRTHKNAPDRAGMVPVDALSYPNTQED